MNKEDKKETNKEMLDEESIKTLTKQQYRVVGKNKHSAVKVCGWTKNLIRGKGGCYKLKFYGIMSHQCLQMSTSISCANRCTFCWRGYKAPVSKDWKWGVDEPEEIIEESLKAQEELLNGFGGSKTANKKYFEESKTVRHVALSLTGEPIIYPRINDIIKEFHKRRISTFIVTNAQYPEAIKNLEPITQLYVSVDAPNPELLKKVDVPLFEDYWERLQKSLEYLKEKKHRTAIRLTMIKEVNMIEPENYAELIKKGDPDFVEVKGYMFVGASRQRLSIKNMPYHEEVVEFAKELAKFLPEYELVSEHKPSRVVLFAKKKYYDPETKRWLTWIDFEKFFELTDKGEEITSEKYGVRWTNKKEEIPEEATDESTEEIELD